MRRLTMVRTNSYVDMLTTLHIYIEDSATGDTLINGIYCRKIGELANGERKTFEIEEAQAKIFAIADNVRQDVCNEYYQLSEGSDHVFLSGQNMIHPTDGHIFRFDQNVSQRHKMSIKKKRNILAISIAAGLALVCLLVVVFWPKGPSGAPKTFTHAGVSITLTDAFEEVRASGYVAAYKTEYIEVGLIRQGFYFSPELKNYSETQYANTLMNQNGIDAVVESGPGKPTHVVFAKRHTEKNMTYQYYCYIYKKSEAFWIVQIGVPKEMAPGYEDRIHQWATSVDFN